MNQCIGNDLPEDMLLHILSKMKTKEVIQRICRVSRRWFKIWKSVPSLNLNSDSFKTVADFDDFVLSVLSQRGNLPMKVRIYRRHGKKYRTNQVLFEKVISLAVSSGVEDVVVDLRRSSIQVSSKVQVPTILFGSKSLKRLEFSYCSFSKMKHGKSFLLHELSILHFVPWSSLDDYRFIFLSKPLGVNFRHLSTLHLNRLSLKYKKTDSVSPFSGMLHLKKLHLSQICIGGTNPRAPIPKMFVISSPQLTKLQLTCNDFNCKVEIVAPMLSNLMYLYSTLWTDFRIHFPSMEKCLLIDIKEHEEAKTPTAHCLIKLKWTRGANVKVLQNYAEVRCCDAPFMNLEKFINRDAIFTECGEGSTTIT